MSEILIVNEDRNVWQMYLEKGQYDMAVNYCKVRGTVWVVWVVREGAVPIAILLIVLIECESEGQSINRAS